MSGRRVVALVAVAAALLAGCTGGPILANPPVVRPAGPAPSVPPIPASDPIPVVLPRDDAAHDRLTEWWYYTGHLLAADGRRFGFQLTFFRTALVPAPVPRASAWATGEIYLAHFAVTDVAGQRFHHAERVSRAALGLAGARARPFRVWLEDWTAEATGPQTFPTRLRAAAGSVAIDLGLEAAKPVVLHGDRGLSRKSVRPGHASYYYSLTRLEAHGAVTLGDEPVAVRGRAWMDREWSTGALDADLAGWDWFGLQLDDGRDLMVYRLRRRDGSADPASAGTLVAADGGGRPLALADVELTVLDTWRSPRDGRRYPARWRLRIPDEDLTLDVRPRVADQELDVTVRYWEGAVAVQGTRAGRPVAGEGYVELVGYGDGPAARPGGSAPDGSRSVAPLRRRRSSARHRASSS